MLYCFPGVTSGKQPACQCSRHKRGGFNPCVRKIPLEEGMATPVFLRGESHQQRSLASYSPWGHKELDMTERLTLPISLFIRYINV